MTASTDVAVGTEAALSAAELLDAEVARCCKLADQLREYIAFVPETVLSACHSVPAMAPAHTSNPIACDRAVLWAIFAIYAIFAWGSTLGRATAPFEISGLCASSCFLGVLCST